MTDPPPMVYERYPLAFASYDRAVLWQALTTTMSTWQQQKGRRQRCLYMCRLTLDALDQAGGDTLQTRWQFFEEHTFPKWRAGERNPLMSNTWRDGINALILTRFIVPGWQPLHGLRMHQVIRRLPDSNPLKQQFERLSEAVGSLHWAKYPVKRQLAVDRGIKLMLVNGYQKLEEIQERDLFNGTRSDPFGYMGVGSDILDGALCALGIFERTPRRNSSRRLRTKRLTIVELVAKYDLPEPFRLIAQLYLETASVRLNWTHSHLRNMCRSIGAFWQYIHQGYPQLQHSTQILPRHGSAFIDYTLQAATAAGEDLSTGVYGNLLNVRTFFSDLCLWAAEPGSKFAAYAPPTSPFSRQDLSRPVFEKARKKAAERLKATIFDLERELPKIRAYGLQSWLVTEEQLKGQPESEAAIDTEADTF